MHGLFAHQEQLVAPGVRTGLRARHGPGKLSQFPGALQRDVRSTDQQGRAAIRHGKRLEPARREMLLHLARPAIREETILVEIQQLAALHREVVRLQARQRTKAPVERQLGLEHTRHAAIRQHVDDAVAVHTDFTERRAVELRVHREADGDVLEERNICHWTRRREVREKKHDGTEVQKCAKQHGALRMRSTLPVASRNLTSASFHCGHGDASSSGSEADGLLANRRAVDSVRALLHYESLNALQGVRLGNMRERRDDGPGR